MSATMSSVCANLSVVETKLIDPDSPATVVETDVPSSCSAFESASPSLLLVPSLIMAAVRLARPVLSAGSN